MPLTDVEISRALNALSTTFNDQRPQSLDAERAQEIVDGALAHERKMTARATGERSGELRTAEDNRLVATVELKDGKWVISRELKAGESSWALPQPQGQPKPEAQ